MSTPKLDFLKRYKTKKKKTKKKAQDNGKLQLIIDCDIHLPTANPQINEFSEGEDFDEDAPLIAGIIDERPGYLKAADDLFERSKWKAVENHCTESASKIDTNFKAVKLEIGERLPTKRLKAAQKASQYAKIVTSSNKNMDNQTSSWRNIEAVSLNQVTLNSNVSTYNSQSDDDSDLSPERPNESIRTDLNKTCSTTVRKKEAALREQEIQQQRQDMYKTWTKGIVQSKESENLTKSLYESKDQPLTRYKDDNELDEFMKNQEREGDPMAKFMQSKVVDDPDEKNKIKKCKYPTTPNRFGIEAGFRWDGVDRSNGFEKKIINMAACKKSISEHAYKWRVEDM